MGPADGLRPRLGESQEANLALLHEPSHRSHRVLDRHTGVDAMLVIAIDHVDAQALQAVRARLSDILRPAIDTFSLAVAAHLTKFSDKHDLISSALNGASNHFLVMSPAIHVGGIEVVNATVDGLANEILRFSVVGGAIDTRQGHAAQPDRAHG